MPSPVRFHDLGGDGKTDALAAGVSIARFGHAIKGLENALELARGHTRPPIADRHREPRIVPLDRHIHRRTLGTIAHCIAQHVFDRASQQIAVAVDQGPRGAAGLDAAALGGALEVRIAHDFLDYLVHIEGLALERRVGAGELRELEHLADQRIQALDFPLQPVELAREIGARLARESEREAHPRKRRAQLVRYVAQQPRDGAAVGAQPVGHGIEITRKHRELVLAALEAGAHAHIEALAGERSGAFLDPPDRSAQVLCEPPACERAHHERNAQDAKGNARQAERTEDARPVRHEHHGVGRAVGRDDLRQHALRTKVAMAARRRAGRLSRWSPGRRARGRRACERGGSGVGLGDRIAEEFQPPRGALGEAPPENVLSARTDDVQITIGRDVLVRGEPLAQRRDAALRKHFGGLQGHRRPALELARLVVASRHGERHGDAAGDDDRHGNPEQHENPYEETMHGAA